MKYIILVFTLFQLYGCVNKIGPINGCYQTKDEILSACVIDSSLYMMKGNDTMIIYNLSLYSSVNHSKNFLRLYNVNYYKSLSRDGFSNFDIPFKYKYDASFGGDLMALFTDDDQFIIGGYIFYRQIDESSSIIFNRYNNLLMENLDTKMLGTK